MIKGFRLLLTLSFLFSALPFLIAHPHKVRADKLFRLGRHADAVSLYKQYLDTGKAVDDFADVLIKVSMLEQDILKGLIILLLYDSKISKADQRCKIFRRIGFIQEYLGDDSAASAAYRVVFKNSGFDLDYQAYLRSGFLALESGNIHYALDIADQIFGDVADTDLRVSAFILAISAYALNSNFDAGLALIKQESHIIKFAGPSYYYALSRFYRVKQSHNAEKIRKFILTKYPKSPEAMLIRSEIRAWISPANLFF